MQNRSEQKVITMTVSDLSKAAFSGRKPDGLTTLDELLWYRLRDLYDAVKAGTMTTEQARKQKDIELLYHNAKVMRAERINTILRQYAGAIERKDDGDTAV